MSINEDTPFAAAASASESDLATWAESAEASAREAAKAHAALWGDGPPYFSVATQPFWKHVADGVFRLARCGACAWIYFPPRVVCPHCWAVDAGGLVETPAHGTIASYTDVHVGSLALKPLLPVRLVVVDLDEGVRLATWLRGPDAGDAQVGDRCHIVIETILDRPYFVARRSNASGVG